MIMLKLNAAHFCTFCYKIILHFINSYLFASLIPAETDSMDSRFAKRNVLENNIKLACLIQQRTIDDFPGN
jgi:hypothetical protein